jgi:hypothetical protein
MMFHYFAAAESYFQPDSNHAPVHVLCISELCLELLLLVQSLGDPIMFTLFCVESCM